MKSIEIYENNNKIVVRYDDLTETYIYQNYRYSKEYGYVDIFLPDDHFICLRNFDMLERFGVEKNAIVIQA